MPLDPLTGNLIKFGLQGIPAIIQGISGLRQSRNARNIKLPDRPEYQIPNALMQRIGLDKTQMNSQMPGTSYYQNQIAGNAAAMRNTAQRNSTDANQNLLMAASANQQSNKAQSQLMGQQAHYQALQEDQYKDSLNALAKEQNAEWKWNVGDKYQQEYDAKMGLKNSLMAAGRKNQWAGLNNLASAGVDFGSDQGWFGGATPPTTGGNVGNAFPTPPTLGGGGLLNNYQGLPGNYRR